MKGTLKNKEGKWVVEYVTHYKEVMEENNAKYSVEDSFITELPLHPDNHTDYVLDNNGYFNFYNGKEVEFEIVEIYNGKCIPDEKGCHCYLKYAKLISKQEELPSEQESWNEIFEKHWKECEHNHMANFQDWLTQNYNPPTNKK